MGRHGSVCLGDGVHKIGSVIKKLMGPKDAIPLNLIKLFWEKINRFSLKSQLIELYKSPSFNIYNYT